MVTDFDPALDFGAVSDFYTAADHSDVSSAPSTQPTVSPAGQVGVAKAGPCAVSERPWVCRDHAPCTKSFARPQDLVRHQKVHSSELPYRCHCGWPFSRLDNLRIHLGRRHADSPQRNAEMLAYYAAGAHDDGLAAEECSFMDSPEDFILPPPYSHAGLSVACAEHDTDNGVGSPAPAPPVAPPRPEIELVWSLLLPTKPYPETFAPPPIPAEAFRAIPLKHPRTMRLANPCQSIRRGTASSLEEAENYSAEMRRHHLTLFKRVDTRAFIYNLATPIHLLPHPIEQMRGLRPPPQHFQPQSYFPLEPPPSPTLPQYALEQAFPASPQRGPQYETFPRQFERLALTDEYQLHGLAHEEDVMHCPASCCQPITDMLFGNVAIPPTWATGFVQNSDWVRDNAA